MSTYKFLGVTVLVSSIGLVAQTQPTDAQKPITVSGCIQPGVPAPIGTTGTDGVATSEETKYLLTNTAVPPSAASDAAVGTPSAATGTTYRLLAGNVRLAAHVGEQVEIVGQLEVSPSQGAAISQETLRNASAEVQPKLTVQTIKTIAARCRT